MLEELSLMIPGRISDPRLSDVVVTRVETTQDLAFAKVYIALSRDSAQSRVDADASPPAEPSPVKQPASSGSDQDRGDIEDALQVLTRAQAHLHGELAGLGLRRIPAPWFC